MTKIHTPQPDYPTPVEPVRPEPSPNDPKPIPEPMQLSGWPAG